MVLLLAAFAGLVGYHVSSIQPEPRSNGIRLSDWLRNVDHDYLKTVNPEVIRLIEGFGEESIPLLFAEYRTAGTPMDRRLRWLVKKLPVDLPEQSVEGRRRFKALTGLAVLGRRYPDRVEPLWASLNTMPESGMLIPVLGTLGRCYLPLLTNLVATGTQRNAGIAIEALSFMGTNAQSAVPLVLHAFEIQWRAGIFYGEDAALVQQMGIVTRAAVERLLVLLNDPELSVRQASAHFLANLTNHTDTVAPEMRRLAGLPMLAGHDPGRWVARYLPKVGVSAMHGVPPLMLRLRVALSHDPAIAIPENAFEFVRALAEYGGAAREVIPLVEKGLYPALLSLADPVRTPDPDDLKLARRRLEQFERTLRKIDPGWTSPARRNSHRRGAGK